MKTDALDHIAQGSPDAYREFIAECAGVAAIQANLAVTYASIGDDIGLDYSIRRLVAYTKAAVSTLADLKARKAALDQKEQPRRPAAKEAA